MRLYLVRMSLQLAGRFIRLQKAPIIVMNLFIGRLCHSEANGHVLPSRRTRKIATVMEQLSIMPISSWRIGWLHGNQRISGAVACYIGADYHPASLPVTVAVGRS